MKQTLKIIDDYDKNNQTSKTDLLIKKLKKEKKNFQTISTGYSTKIIVENSNIDYFLAETFSGEKFFYYVNKLKKEIKESGIFVDEIPQDEIKYFDIYQKINEIDFSMSEKSVYCIDINSAYLSVLFKEGFISQDLFIELSQVEKEIRLKIVGSLATQKTIIKYIEGKPVSIESKTDENMRNIFFYLCYEIGRTMNHIKQYCRQNYLFFWVDGIYFFSDEKYICEPKFINTLFSAYGFETKTEQLFNFSVSKNHENIYLNFFKDKELTKKKSFIIPLQNTIKNINKNNIKKTEHELNSKN